MREEQASWWDRHVQSIGKQRMHIFHKMIGYYVKDAEKDHFQTLDHNTTVDDTVLGREQLALHGYEECKNWHGASSITSTQ